MQAPEQAKLRPVKKPTANGVGPKDVGARVATEGYECEGTLRYFGPHATKPHLRAGIELDEPLGRNNGTVAGHKYFECEAGYGVLVVAEKVTKLTPEPTTSPSQDIQPAPLATVRKASQKQKTDSNLVVALFNFQGAADDDLSFVKGDHLRLLDDSDPDWWMAQTVDKKRKGRCPTPGLLSTPSPSQPKLVHAHGSTHALQGRKSTEARNVDLKNSGR